MLKAGVLLVVLFIVCQLSESTELDESLSWPFHKGLNEFSEIIIIGKAGGDNDANKTFEIDLKEDVTCAEGLSEADAMFHISVRYGYGFIVFNNYVNGRYQKEERHYDMPITTNSTFSIKIIVFRDMFENYKEKDANKVVLYSTTMGIVRETYHACMKVKQILRTLLVKYEERDVFMSGEYQAEIRERMRCDHILVPQVFVDGQHIGDAETIERLNETGELRRLLKPYKSMDVCTTCQTCGGYRLLPCPVCNGSKKSVHRNHFTTEFVALKCMNCDEVGLVKCSAC